LVQFLVSEDKSNPQLANRLLQTLCTKQQFTILQIGLDKHFIKNL
jgi:hypothetical protein